jgi:hypothetical protein
VLSHYLGPSEDVVEEDGNLDLFRVVARADAVYEEKGRRYGMNDTVWAHRRQSPWGPHWRCEDQSHTTPEKHARLSPLLVCRAL